MNNTKKLLLYSLDCIKATSKNTAFCNLKGNKENKFYYTNETVFDSDNKDIIEIMTKYALNKSTMGLYYGSLFLDGSKGKNKYYSPLLYYDAELIRENDKIRLVYDENNININISVISSLLENDEEIIEEIIRQLLEINEPQKIDFIKVLSGLIDLNGFNIIDCNSIILTKTPESVAGLIDELKQLIELY